MSKEKRTQAKHTPGPWLTGTTESTKYAIYSRLGYCIANSFNGVFVGAACEANARRIVACVNACDGFSIEELEGADLFKDSIDSDNIISEMLEQLQYAVWVCPELEKNEKLMSVIAKAGGN